MREKCAKVRISASRVRQSEEAGVVAGCCNHVAPREPHKAKRGVGRGEKVRGKAKVNESGKSAPPKGVAARGKHGKEVRARAGAQQLQGLRRQWHLRARAAAQPVQGLRRQQHLRARAAAHPVQGLRRHWHLRARTAAQVPERLRWKKMAKKSPSDN